METNDYNGSQVHPNMALPSIPVAQAQGEPGSDLDSLVREYGNAPVTGTGRTRRIVMHDIYRAAGEIFAMSKPAPQAQVEPVARVTFAHEVDGPWRLELNGVPISRHSTRGELDEAIKALRSALSTPAAQAQVEPVAHVVDIDRNTNESIINAALEPGTAVYLGPAAQADEVLDAWISVAERLPQTEGWYPVLIGDPDDIGWATDVWWRAEFRNGEWSGCDPIEDGQPVTHWIDAKALRTTAADNQTKGE